MTSSAATAIAIGKTSGPGAQAGGDQDDERRLGRVGDRGERVGGEDREREALCEEGAA